MGSGPPSPSAKPSLLETQGLPEPHEDTESTRCPIPLSGCLEPRFLRPWLPARCTARPWSPTIREAGGRRPSPCRCAAFAVQSWSAAYRRYAGASSRPCLPWQVFELDLRAPLDSRAPPGASRLPETVADLHFFTQAPHTANQCRYASVGAVLCECLVRVVSHGVQGCADCSESAGERPGSAGVRVVVRSAEVESDVSGKLLNLRGTYG